MALTALLACLILVMRLPEAVLRAEFWAEDGIFYLHALNAGITSLLEPYAGYLIVGIRAGSLAESIAPPSQAPLVGNVIALVTMAMVAAFATSTRLPWSRAVGWLIAVLIALVPIGFEVIGTLVHIVWPLTIWLALTAISAPPRTRAGRVAEMVGISVSGLTGAGALLAWPLFLRGPRYRLAAVIVVCAIQIGVLAFASASRPAGDVDVGLVPYAWLLRGVVTPLLGATVAGALPAGAVLLVGAVALIAIAASLAGAPLAIRVLVIWLFAFLPMAGIIAGGEPTRALAENTAWAPRYFWSASVAFAVLMATSIRRPLIVPLIALMAVGIVAEFRIQPAVELGWSSRSACIGSPRPCDIPVAPGEKWTIRWRP
jgi:hypothetical protein